MTQRISVKTEYIKDLLSQIYKQHNEITSLHGLVKELRAGLDDLLYETSVADRDRARVLIAKADKATGDE